MIWIVWLIVNQTEWSCYLKTFTDLYEVRSPAVEAAGSDWNQWQASVGQWGHGLPPAHHRVFVYKGIFLYEYKVTITHILCAISLSLFFLTHTINLCLSFLSHSHVHHCHINLWDINAHNSTAAGLWLVFLS